MRTSFNLVISLLLIIEIFPHFPHAGEKCALGELVFYDTSNSQIPRTYIRTINTDDSGRVWAGSVEGGLGVFNGNTWNVLTKENSGLPSNNITKIAFDHKNNTWIGTDSGLVKHDGTTWTVYTPENSFLKGLYIRAIAFDRNDNIWCNDGGNGANVLMFSPGNEGGKSFVPENPGYFLCTMMDILIDSSNTAWVGLFPCGLARIEGDSCKVFNRDNSIMVYDWVDKLELDKEGMIWVGQSIGASSEIDAGGLLSVTHDAKHWKHNSPSQTGKASNNIGPIACDKRGYLWVSTHGSFPIKHDVVSIFNKKQWISFTINNDATARPYYITDIAVDKHNNVWFATLDGCILLLKQDTSAIDSLFAKEGVGVKHEFRLIPKQKREMLYHDVLGRKSPIKGDDVKKANGVLIGSDNIKTKKIVTVK